MVMKCRIILFAHLQERIEICGLLELVVDDFGTDRILTDYDLVATLLSSGEH